MADPVRSHRDLIVWQKAMDVAQQVICEVQLMDKVWRFSLESQIIRAAASVPAYIAEGFARGSAKAYRRFLSIARGALVELQTFLMLAQRSGVIPVDRCDAMLAPIEEVARLLSRLRDRVRNPG